MLRLTKKIDYGLIAMRHIALNQNQGVISAKEIAEKNNVHAELIDGPADIQSHWFEGVNSIGVTAGASAPEILVQQVVEKLKSLGAEAATEADGEAENVTFTLPKALKS